jgi:hypothetical protein
VRAGMRLHGFHRGFYDRAVENAPSTWDNGLIVTSVVRQMNRGRATPSSIITKSPGFGVGSRPSP